MPTIDALLRSFDLKPAGEDRYLATNVSDRGFLFGGQLIAQSILAALARHPGKTVKTVHTIFVRAGSNESPVEIALDPVHDGRSFASTDVTISQAERVCARSLVLLTAEEPDLYRHGDPAPALTPPAAAPVAGQGDWRLQVAGGVDLDDPDVTGPPDVDVWTRFDGAPADSAIDQALVAYSTEVFLIGASMRPHKGIGQSQAHVTLSTGVISHTLTFHEPVSAGEWFLISNHSDYAGHGRVHGRASIFRADGTFAASLVQDALVRPRNGAKGTL